MKRKAHRIGETMMRVFTQVEINPGQTAYWHRFSICDHPRMTYLYAAFERAERYGMIRHEWNENHTRKLWYPVENWRDQYPELNNG